MSEEGEMIVQNRKSRRSLAKTYKIPFVVFGPQTQPWVKEHRVGRNDDCPCGAGRSVEDEFGIIQNIPNKYKNCCMKSGKYETYKTK